MAEEETKERICLYCRHKLENNGHIDYCENCHSAFEADIELE